MILNLRPDQDKCSLLRKIKSNYNYRLCGDKRNLVTRADCQDATPEECARFENNFKDNVLGCTLHQATEGKEFVVYFVGSLSEVIFGRASLSNSHWRHNRAFLYMLTSLVPRVISLPPSRE